MSNSDQLVKEVREVVQMFLSKAWEGTVDDEAAQFGKQLFIEGITREIVGNCERLNMVPTKKKIAEMVIECYDRLLEERTEIENKLDGLEEIEKNGFSEASLLRYKDSLCHLLRIMANGVLEEFGMQCDDPSLIEELVVEPMIAKVIEQCKQTKKLPGKEMISEIKERLRKNSIIDSKMQQRESWTEKIARKFFK